MLLSLSVLLLLNVLVCESFVITSFKTNRWSGGVQKIPPVRSLFCAPEDIPSTVVLSDPELDALYQNITSAKVLWEEFCQNVTDCDVKDIVHKELATLWTQNDCEDGGSTLSSDAYDMSLVHDRSVHTKPIRDELGVIGHANAINMIYAAVKDKTPISKQFLDTLNKVLVGHVNTTLVTYPEGQNRSMACVTGEYRKFPVVMKYKDRYRTTPEPEQIDSAMELVIDMCNHSLADVPSITVAVSVHSFFTLFHPYQAGNERQALLLMAYVLMKAGLPPALMFEHEHAEYVEAQELAHKAHNPNSIIRYLAERVYAMQNIMFAMGNKIVNRENEEVHVESAVNNTLKNVN